MATILTLIRPFPFREGSRPRQLPRLTLLIAFVIELLEGFFGPVFFGFEEPVIALKPPPLLFRLPPFRLLRRAVASDFFDLDELDLAAFRLDDRR